MRTRKHEITDISLESGKILVLGKGNKEGDGIRAALIAFTFNYSKKRSVKGCLLFKETSSVLLSDLVRSNG
ncbi:hypothetical protein [Neobacillus sp. LXY-1]|uniref:hypothetical protein n=1 Tax=Neobacillus sp. LXY-1 TaxID=3379133 RepID=UPI003EE16213